MNPEINNAVMKNNSTEGNGKACTRMKEKQ